MSNTIRIPQLRKITITDPLFGRYAALVSSTVIPYQWRALNDQVPGAEPSHCIENFRIAAGEAEGPHRGVVFSDTDAYKWLEAVAYCIENGSGETFIETADGLIDLIGRAQQPDGYLNTYYTIAHPEQRWTNLAEGHELYGAGHLIEAAVAYYRATGKDALLRIACRFADLIDETFGPEPGKSKGYPGHQVVELALVKLYRATGEKRYLQLARHFVDERGKAPNYLLSEMERHGGSVLFPDFSDYDAAYAQTHLPPRQQRTAEGHAVRALYLYSAMADLAKECGDDGLKTACRALYDSIAKKRMYITGGVGSSGHLERFTADYDLPNDRMYCETCASVGLMMFGQRMAALTRDASYYDLVERALCNTVLSGMSATGDRYFYVNPLEVWPDNCLPSTSLSHVKPVRQAWFACSCCPPNVARTLSSLGQYIYAEDDKSLYINQFISSDISTEIQGCAVGVSMDASYMRDGCVRLTVDAPSPKPFTIRVRMPGYFENPTFTLDGKPIMPVIENGYAVLAVSHAGTQTFLLSGCVRPKFYAANLSLRADMGRIALMKGPFVYCLEECDNGSNLAALSAAPDAAASEREPLPGLPGALPTLQIAGERVVSTVSEPDALYGTPAYVSEKATLTAVPYCLWCNRKPGEMTVWIKAR